MGEMDAVQLGTSAVVGGLAVLFALLTLVLGDSGAWNTRIALFLMAAIPGGVLLDRVRRALRER